MCFLQHPHPLPLSRKRERGKKISGRGENKSRRRAIFRELLAPYKKIRQNDYKGLALNPRGPKESFDPAHADSPFDAPNALFVEVLFYVALSFV